MIKEICTTCKGEGWVCENHSDVKWNGGNQSCCEGAGVPCGCNTSDPPWHHVDLSEEGSPVNKTSEDE